MPNGLRDGNRTVRNRSTFGPLMENDAIGFPHIIRQILLDFGFRGAKAENSARDDLFLMVVPVLDVRPAGNDFASKFFGYHLLHLHHARIGVGRFKKNALDDVVIIKLTVMAKRTHNLTVHHVGRRDMDRISFQ